MSSLMPVSVHLSKHQVRKAATGHPIQISAENLHKATHTLHVHPENHKKIHKAKRARKGVRIHLTEHELHGSGLLDWLKGAWNTVKSKVIDTPFYQNTVRPAAKQGVNALIDNFVPSAARDLAHQAANAVGEKTGAFGMRMHRSHMPKHHFHLQSAQQHMISPEHPAFHPGLPLRPIGGEMMPEGRSHIKKTRGVMPKVRSHAKKRGGSLIPVGY